MPTLRVGHRQGEKKQPLDRTFGEASTGRGDDFKTGHLVSFRSADSRRDVLCRVIREADGAKIVAMGEHDQKQQWLSKETFRFSP
jgi:hypothetical protein